MKYIILGIFALIGIVAIWFVNTYNKLQYLLIKINKSDINVEKALVKKYNCLIKLIEFLNKKIKINEDEFYELLNINLEKVNHFKLDDIIIESSATLQEYINENNELSKDNEFKKIINEINEANIVIISCRKYYNNNVEIYNNSIERFPKNIVGKVYKYKKRKLYNEIKNTKLKILETE